MVIAHSYAGTNRIRFKGFAKSVSGPANINLARPPQVRAGLYRNGRASVGSQDFLAVGFAIMLGIDGFFLWFFLTKSKDPDKK